VLKPQFKPVGDGPAGVETVIGAGGLWHESVCYRCAENGMLWRGPQTDQAADARQAAKVHNRKFHQPAKASV